VEKRGAGRELALKVAVDAETKGEAELGDAFVVSIVPAWAKGTSLALEVRAAEGWLVGGADARAVVTRPAGGGGAALLGAAPRGFLGTCWSIPWWPALVRLTAALTTSAASTLDAGAVVGLRRGGWPRLAMVRFGGATGARLLGEELWLRWWQQCRCAAICGV
jgi:hypothetical protein